VGRRRDVGVGLVVQLDDDARLPAGRKPAEMVLDGGMEAPGRGRADREEEDGERAGGRGEEADERSPG
jgi:hypothetical protein